METTRGATDLTARRDFLDVTMEVTDGRDRVGHHIQHRIHERGSPTIFRTLLARFFTRFSRPRDNRRLIGNRTFAHHVRALSPPRARPVFNNTSDVSGRKLRAGNHPRKSSSGGSKGQPRRFVSEINRRLIEIPVESEARGYTSALLDPALDVRSTNSAISRAGRDLREARVVVELTR